jgi:hypothetical protein
MANAVPLERATNAQVKYDHEPREKAEGEDPQADIQISIFGLFGRLRVLQHENLHREFTTQQVKKSSEAQALPREILTSQSLLRFKRGPPNMDSRASTVLPESRPI